MTKQLLLELIGKLNILDLMLHLLISSLMWFSVLFAGLRILKVKVKLKHSIPGVLLLACNSLFLRPFTPGLLTFFTMLIPPCLLLKFYSKSKWAVSFFVTAILVLSTAVFPMLFIAPLTSSNPALIPFFKSQYGVMIGSLTETLGVVVLLALLNVFNVATIPTPGQTVFVDIFIFGGSLYLCFYLFMLIWERPGQFLIMPCIGFLVSAALFVANYIKKTNEHKTIEIMDQEIKRLKNMTNSDIPDFGDKLDMYFTRREQEILMLLAQGMSNDEIAKEFSVSIGTVGNLVSRVKDKVEVENRNQLVLFSLAWTSKNKPVKRQD